LTIPITTVEIGFDLDNATATVFTLDDDVRGLLDNDVYLLGGTIFFDVTDKVKSVAVRRGKNRQLDEYDAGLANIVFDNNDRTFDPTFANSPYAGQIIPKRAVRISSNGERLFTGVIDDWNLSYDPSGNSEASAAASDAFTLFNTQTMPAGTATAQLTSERLNAVLNLPDVTWSQLDRDIEVGGTLLGSDLFPNNGNVLAYMRQVANSEPGNLYMSKTGALKFTNRQTASGGLSVVFADDGTGIKYNGMKVVFGSELLFNEIVLGSQAAGTVVATDQDSIDEYGVLNLTQNDLLLSSPDYLANLAFFYAIKYSQPEYRFESIDVILNDLSPAQQATMISLEIADFVTVRFTPNGIAPAIERIAEVIRIDHDITPSGHIISLGFSTVDTGFFTLSDPIFGRLSTGNVLGF
jgi:hypothetical protein